MHRLFSLLIGGIVFELVSRHALSVIEDDRKYSHFISPGNASLYNDHVSLVLETGDVPDENTMARLFETEVWSAFSGEDKYLFRSPLLSDPGAQLYVQCDRDFTRGSISCSTWLNPAHLNRSALMNPLHYPVDQVLLMHALPRKSGTILHAAGVIVKGKAYLFPGKSGAGKSTLSRILAERKDVKALSDDRIIVRKTGDCFQAFGTPWPGDAGFALNESAPLGGIFFIRHGNENKAIRRSSQGAAESLMPVTSIPWYDEEAVSGIFRFFDGLVSTTPAYDLHFKPDQGIGTFLEKFLLP